MDYHEHIQPHYEIPTEEAVATQIASLEAQGAERLRLEDQLQEQEVQINETRKALGLTPLETQLRWRPDEQYQAHEEGVEQKARDKSLQIIQKLGLSDDETRTVYREYYHDLDSAASYTEARTFTVQRSGVLTFVEVSRRNLDKPAASIEQWLIGNFKTPLESEQYRTPEQRRSFSLRSTNLGSWESFHETIEDVAAELATEQIIQDAVEVLAAAPLTPGRFSDEYTRSVTADLNKHQAVRLIGKYYLKQVTSTAELERLRLDELWEAEQVASHRVDVKTGFFDSNADEFTEGKAAKQNFKRTLTLLRSVVQLKDK